MNKEIARKEKIRVSYIGMCVWARNVGRMGGLKAVKFSITAS